MDKYITLAHGSGGKKTSELIESIFLPAFSNDNLNDLGDGALLSINGNNLIFSTDSFVIKPIFYPGGDIGKLSVCGTVNDIAVSGGIPLYLSLSFIIEEGFAIDDLKKIIESIKQTSQKCNVKIVTGDTKVVEKGQCDGIYINTAGIGILKEGIALSKNRIKKGDKVIISGTVGDHGIAVLSAREGLFQSDTLISDCNPIQDITNEVLKEGLDIRIMRDPTRGGVATTLNEFIEKSPLGINLYDKLIPIRKDVSVACDMLGIDPLYSANEGKVLIVCSEKISKKLIDNIKKLPFGENAAIIGEVIDYAPSKVLLDTGYGTHRILDKLSGVQLPRIC